MGNVLATAQAGLSIENDPSARDAKEIFDSLEDMAQDRLDLFYEKTLCASSLLLPTALA